MRPETLYLTDILDATDAIVRFLDNVEKDKFLTDEMRQSAILQKLIVIGEAASHLSTEFRDQHPEVEWRDVVGFRNFAVHEYFDVNWEIVWNTVILDVPMLRLHVTKIVADENSDNSDS